MIELDVRPIPQLYGTSYPYRKSEEAMPPSPNQLLGSCLSASLEMMVDWLKRENRAKAYSSFRNAAALDGVLTRQGHPNGDQTVHLMWNQATLHNTIYGSAQRLLHLLGSKRSDGGFGLKTRTVSRKKPQSPAPGETVEVVSSDKKYEDWIRKFIMEDECPVIALVENISLEHREPLDVKRMQNPLADRPPLSELPPSDINHEERTTPNGHAVVLAGLHEHPLGAINYPSMLGRKDLLVLDPSPSIELENNPSRFYEPPTSLTDPAVHTHRVELDEFVPSLKQTRGLITFDMEDTFPGVVAIGNWNVVPPFLAD